MARHRSGVTGSWDSLECRPFWDRIATLGKPGFSQSSHLSRALQAILSNSTSGRDGCAVTRTCSASLPTAFPGVCSSQRQVTLWKSLTSFFNHSGRQRTQHFSFLFRFHSATSGTTLQGSAVAVAAVVKEIGSHRLMWGTDMPNVERFCTYRQSLDLFRKHCQGVISNDDIDNITGRTATRVFALRV